MAVTSRLNRNVGHENTMTRVKMGHGTDDEFYEGLVRDDLTQTSHNIFVLNSLPNANAKLKQELWLRLMGLMETYTIVEVFEIKK